MDKKIGFRSLWVALAVAVLSIALSLETEAKKYDFTISAGYTWSHKDSKNQGSMLAGQFHLPVYKGFEFAPELSFIYLKESESKFWQTDLSLRALAGCRIPSTIIDLYTGPRMDIVLVQKEDQSSVNGTPSDNTIIKYRPYTTVVAYWQFRIDVGMRKFKVFFDYSLPMSHYLETKFEVAKRYRHIFEVGASFTFKIGR